MKIVRYIVMAGLICSNQISLSMHDPIAGMIVEHQIWLNEQLTQLGYSDLNAKVINELVTYFGEKTNAFYGELIYRNKMITTDLFEEEMSIAAGRMVTAAEHAHAKEKISKTKNMLRLEDVITEIIYSGNGRLYEGAVDLFPDMN